jgi:hypothetical protein
MMFDYYTHYCEQYGLSHEVFCALVYNSEWVNKEDLAQHVYYAHAYIMVNGKQRTLIVDLSFEQLLSELKAYTTDNQAEDSSIDFKTYFDDNSILWEYVLYLFRYDGGDIDDQDWWMSIERRQALV